MGAVLGAGLDQDPRPERRQADGVLHELRAAGAVSKPGELGGERPARPLSGQGLIDSPVSLQRVGLTGPRECCLQVAYTTCPSIGSTAVTCSSTPLLSTDS